MPIRPSPKTYTCKQCGWSKTTAPVSDALTPNDHFDHCPKCGNTDLSIETANWVQSTIATLENQLAKWKRSHNQ